MFSVMGIVPAVAIVAIVAVAIILYFVLKNR